MSGVFLLLLEGLYHFHCGSFNTLNLNILLIGHLVIEHSWFSHWFVARLGFGGLS